MNNQSTVIKYPTNPMTSDISSRGINVSGLQIKPTVAHDGRANERIEVVEIFPINSRGEPSSKFLRLPMESTTLRQLAAKFNELADQAEGRDWSSRVQKHIDTLRHQLPDDESVTELLDDLIHDVITDSRKASFVNNQGWDAQVWHLVNTGQDHLINTRLKD
ncbi:MAG: hypothetical protein AWU57_213 [Marinobacter sp. T13-3]|nr:MAG: hypothetical protein AWU57_213 [Marinobacter sp. T13-3]